MKRTVFKWKSILGLVMIYLALYFSLTWLWGLLFLMWVIPDLVTGVSYFMEPVERKGQPILYWAIVGTWLLLSAYMIASPLLPQEYRADFGASAAGYTTWESGKGDVASQEVGKYEDAEDLVVMGNEENGEKKNAAGVAATEKPDTLKYKLFQAPQQFFAGLTASVDYASEEFEGEVEKLWERFAERDISVDIPNIVDERVYLLYSDYDQPKEGRVKLTLGYRVAAAADNPPAKDLEYLSIAPTPYAVFESSGPIEEFLVDTWTKIWVSDMDLARTFDQEVYTLDPVTYAVKSLELRVSLSK